MEDKNKSTDLRIWYGLTKQPFSDDIKAKDLFLRPCLDDLSNRVQFTIKSGFYFTIVGDVGAGKSSALRYVASQIPQKQVQIISITGGSWSFTELLRQIINAMGGSSRTGHQSTLFKLIDDGYTSIRESGKTPVIFIDECHLYNQDVFSQIHLLSQPAGSNGKIVPVIMCGQTVLLDRILGQYNKPLASRVMDGMILKGMSREETIGYIKHLLCNISGGSDDIMDEGVMNIIFQASGGIPRNINNLCLLSMRCAQNKGKKSVSIEDVRNVNRKWWEV